MKLMKNTIFSIVIMLFIASFSISYAAANVYKGTHSQIDASTSADGYIKVKYLNKTGKKLKVIIENGRGSYTYDLNNNGDEDIYPLQMGNGKYKIRVFENISGSKYAVKQTVTIDVKLNDANAPFLVANQYIDYTNTSETIKKAEELTQGKTDDFEKIDLIYDYIITNISYDTEKAKTVQSGYLPSLDEIFKSNKGICFDYASMMAAMLRSQEIPAKLVMGYSSNVSAYHAWNEVYTEETGWIKLNEMYFDGNEWKLMDSTIASSAKQSNSPRLIDHTNKLIDSKYYTKQFEY